MKRFNFLPVISEGSTSQVSHTSNLLFTPLSYADISLCVRYWKQDKFVRLMMTRFEVWVNGLLVWYSLDRKEALKEFNEYKAIYNDMHDIQSQAKHNQL